MVHHQLPDDRFHRAAEVVTASFISNTGITITTFMGGEGQMHSSSSFGAII